MVGAVCMLTFFFSRSGDLRDLHSFPTRRSSDLPPGPAPPTGGRAATSCSPSTTRGPTWPSGSRWTSGPPRSEEHTSELQSQSNLVCRLLLEKKKHNYQTYHLLAPHIDSINYPIH